MIVPIDKYRLPGCCRPPILQPGAGVRRAGPASMVSIPDALQHEVLLRRAGTVANAGVCCDPGSAAHRFTLRCARETRLECKRCFNRGRY
jgi:hypothetical protein